MRCAHCATLGSAMQITVLGEHAGVCGPGRACWFVQAHAPGGARVQLAEVGQGRLARMHGGSERDYFGVCDALRGARHGRLP